ncbi:hypothetical protein RQP46_008285 [Phenoliferia psychrophenolica]
MLHSPYLPPPPPTRLQTHPQPPTLAHDPPLPFHQPPSHALPNTEPGLYHFLWAARRTARTSTDAATLATIHGHPSLRTLTSSRTYGQVLLLALACSDWALVREVLAEMRERSVAWDELICRTMLVAYLKRGDAVRVKDVLREMRMAGLREPLTYVNWRRDLGDQSRGKGDSWKVWRRRPGPSGLARDSSQVGAAERARASSARASAARPAGTETSFTRFTDADTRIRRTPTFVPSDVGRISNFDVTVLVESLVQDARYSKALAVAETWLAFNRPPAPEPAPPPPPPLPSFITSHPRTPNLTAFNGPRTPTSPLPPPPRRPSISPQVRAYNGAAIILLNILLKVLFVNNLTLAPIKDFIEYFIEHHSLTPSCRIVPNDVTLSTLLKPYLHRSSTFDLEFTRTSNLVNWFGTEFGLPPTPRSLPRVFAPVPQELIDEVYRTEPEQLPVCHVDPTIAWALLRVANIDRERRGAHDPRVSAWWDGLVKRGHGWDRSALRKELQHRATYAAWCTFDILAMKDYC